MKLRVTESGLPDLPRNFAIAGGKTAREGMRQCLDAFAENDAVNLVIWPGAADLLDPGEKKTLFSTLTDLREWRYCQTASEFLLESRRHELFTRFAEEAGMGQNQRKALLAWQRSQEEISSALGEETGRRLCKTTLRTELMLNAPDFHLDPMDNTLLRGLRTVFRAATCFIGVDDIALPPEEIRAQDYRRLAHADFSPKTETSWTLPPFAFALARNAPETGRPAHSSAYDPVDSPPGCVGIGHSHPPGRIPPKHRRALEIMDF